MMKIKTASVLVCFIIIAIFLVAGCNQSNPRSSAQITSNANNPDYNPPTNGAQQQTTENATPAQQPAPQTRSEPAQQPALQPIQQTQQQIYQVTIQNYAFSPSSLNIRLGDTVVWTNMDYYAHTVTSRAGSELNSDYLTRLATYSHTFNTPGTYSHYCTLHSYMTGTIIVE